MGKLETCENIRCDKTNSLWCGHGEKNDIREIKRHRKESNANPNVRKIFRRASKQKTKAEVRRLIEEEFRYFNGEEE